MNKQFIYLLLILFVNISNSFSQSLDYVYFNNSAKNLKEFFSKNKNYQKSGSNELPYFSNGNIEIKFYDAIGETAVFKFKKKNDFNYAVNEIFSKANFDFKYCLEYYSPIIYNLNTSNANEIRIDLINFSIEVQHPSKLGDFMKQNRDMMPVIICTSDNSYAYHTNIKCEGFNNCKTEFIKSNVREVKRAGYKLCLICSSL